MNPFILAAESSVILALYLWLYQKPKFTAFQAALYSGFFVVCAFLAYLKLWGIAAVIAAGFLIIQSEGTLSVRFENALQAIAFYILYWAGAACFLILMFRQPASVLENPWVIGAAGILLLYFVCHFDELSIRNVQLKPKQLVLFCLITVFGLLMSLCFFILVVRPSAFAEELYRASVAFLLLAVCWGGAQWYLKSIQDRQRDQAQREVQKLLEKIMMLETETMAASRTWIHEARNYLMASAKTQDRRKELLEKSGSLHPFSCCDYPLLDGMMALARKEWPLGIISLKTDLLRDSQVDPAVLAFVYELIAWSRVKMEGQEVDLKLEMFGQGNLLTVRTEASSPVFASYHEEQNKIWPLLKGKCAGLSTAPREIRAVFVYE